jgi:hypothetical protein
MMLRSFDRIMVLPYSIISATQISGFVISPLNNKEQLSAVAGQLKTQIRIARAATIAQTIIQPWLRGALLQFLESAAQSVKVYEKLTTTI